MSDVVMDNEEQFVKIFIALPDGTSEALWARPLENNLYEIRNSPFTAFDLNFLDIVKAIPDSPGEKPRILEVVQQSGHKTLRIIFKDADDTKRQQILNDLNGLQARYEKARGTFYTLDVEPQADYSAVCNYLWQLEQKNFLFYETGRSKEPDK